MPPIKAHLVDLTDTDTLSAIRQTLRTRSHFVDSPMFETYFDRILQQKNTKQPVFAIGIDPNEPKHIKLVYSVHCEYKLTRQLCKCAHIEELYSFSKVTKQMVEQFQKDLIPQLDCYKIVAINIEQNATLKPNQKFMIVENKASL